MKIPVTNLLPADISHADRITWIKNNQHVCLNPFQTYYYQYEAKSGKAVLNNNFCCSVYSNSDVDEVKNNIFAGSLSKQCQVCWNLESQTGTSERTLSLATVPSDVLNKFIETGESDSYHYRIKFSNLCNLACRSCAPTFSSKYAQTYKLNVPQELYQDIGYDNSVWDSITSSITNACETYQSVTVMILGGESLIQPGAIKLIDWLTDTKLPVALSITTNLTKLDTKVVERLRHLSYIHLALSIDSVNHNYEYVRWPAKFSDIEKNLSVIFKYTNASLIVQPVWSLNNIFYIIDFLDWWYQWFNTNREIPIKPVVMHHPPSITIQNLPTRYRAQLLTIVDHALKHDIFKSQIQLPFYRYLLELTDFLQTDHVIHDLFDQFLYETAVQDRATGSNFAQGNQNFYKILTESDQTLFKQHPNIKLLPRQSKNFYSLHVQSQI